jgi:hypothetical protein
VFVHLVEKAEERFNVPLKHLHLLLLLRDLLCLALRRLKLLLEMLQLCVPLRNLLETALEIHAGGVQFVYNVLFLFVELLERHLIVQS